MASFSGRRVSVGIGLETERGTSVAPDYWFPQMDINIKDTPTSILNESAYGHIAKNNDKTTTLIEGDGTISGKTWIKGLYYFLALVFGKLPTTTDTDGDTGAKNHAFSLLNSNEHLSATIALKEPNLDVRFPFAMPESFTINWTPDAYATIEIPIKSKKSVDASNTVAYVVDKEFLPKHAALWLADSLAGLSSADPLTGIKSFSLTFTKTLSPQQTMDSGDTYSEIFNTDWEVSGSFEKLYKDTTYRGLALNDTVKSLRFAMTDTVNKAGTTTPTSLTFDLSRVAFNSQEPAYGLSDISTETINFTGLLDMSAVADSFKAVLVNKYTYSS